MYKENPYIETPPDETVIWRYMNFSKFYFLLSNASLYFPSATSLAEIDPYEGSFAKGNLLPFSYDEPPYNELEPNMLKQLENMRIGRRQFSKLGVRPSVYINSWYINDFESAAMWKIYAENEDGIAIRSTVGRLKLAMKDCTELHVEGSIQDIFVGKVVYADYEMDTISESFMFSPFFHKRKSFEHENELRAFVWNNALITQKFPITTFDGIHVRTDIQVLIDSVFVAPTTPIWIKDLVQSVLLQKDLNKKVVKSSMQDGGVW